MKKCRACKLKFEPRNSTQVACSPDCAVSLVRAKKAKAAKVAMTERKKKLKSLSDYRRDAQREFNAYIRERDHHLPCVSCGRHHQGQYHAGHYRTVGSNPELRFEPLNCHKQCAPCNNHKSGDIVNYRLTLVDRIGKEALTWLEGPHKPKKYSVDDLVEMAKNYRAETKRMKAERTT